MDLLTIAVISLTLSVLSFLVIVIDIASGHTQRMKIMNVVWPVTALYAGLPGLWAYYRIGRLSTRGNVLKAGESGGGNPGREKPFWQSVGVAALHCGSGCTLGDIVAETFLLFVPVTLFGRLIFAAWALDYLLAFSFGIAFQYFTIKPMRKLSAAKGLRAALKADTLSLTSWQVGMYGWMAVAVFGIFGHELDKTGPVFWFMMQIAMVCGFVTSYPANWWLLRRGIKEVM